MACLRVQEMCFYPQFISSYHSDNVNFRIKQHYCCKSSFRDRSHARELSPCLSTMTWSWIAGIYTHFYRVPTYEYFCTNLIFLLTHSICHDAIATYRRAPTIREENHRVLVQKRKKKKIFPSESKKLSKKVRINPLLYQNPVKKTRAWNKSFSKVMDRWIIFRLKAGPFRLKQLTNTLKDGPLWYKQLTNKLKIRILSETSIPYLIRHASFILIGGLHL